MKVFAATGFWIAITFVSPAMALDTPTSEQDLASISSKYYETSDGFDRNELSLSYRRHRREFFWPYEEASSRGMDLGLDIAANTGTADQNDYDSIMMLGVIGRRIGRDGYFEGKLGMHQLNYDAGMIDKRMWPWSFWCKLPLGSAAELQLSGKRDFVYQDGVQPAGVTESLQKKNFNTGLEWRPDQRLRVDIAAQYGSWSDDNFNRQYDAAVLYGILPDWPSIWVGLGSEFIQFKHVRDGYWSPKLFSAHGLRIDSSFPIYRRLDASAAVNVDRIKEKGSDAGLGYYLDTGFDWTVGRRMHLRLHYARSSSIQRASRWYDNMVSLSINGSLF